MPRKKPVEPVSIPDIPDIPPAGSMRWVVYTIIVPLCDGTVAIERARRALEQHKIPAHLVHIDVDRGVVSVPRLTTIWQGDEPEQTWQRQIKATIPGVLIDVADWSFALGYPKGSIGEKSEVGSGK